MTSIPLAFAPARERLIRDLAARMRPEGYWEGQLSSSAVATATAVMALAMAGDRSDLHRIGSGVRWLEATQKPEGAWGDTPDSPGNLPTTLLALSALMVAQGSHPSAAAIALARRYVAQTAGTAPGQIAAAVGALYGSDRTFAAPILMSCALAGLGDWAAVPELPYGLAAVPRGLHKLLRLQVVSYALPALIAVGLLVSAKRHPGGVPAALRGMLEPRLLARLSAVQPESGGYLEAIPLTSFVAMALASLGQAEHPVVGRCHRFLRMTQRGDGSWPIDTNLSVWLTTAAISALSAAGAMGSIDLGRMRDWLVARQWRQVHPYTGAAPGGWAWTHTSGGVPDADDTAGAVIAATLCGEPHAAAAGAAWLAALQNSDGGWPTFCRGWGKLPFDRSGADLTAHALRALARAGAETVRHRDAIGRGLQYLRRVQRPDGSWLPLWFGSQLTGDGGSPVFGTARVLRCFEALNQRDEPANRGIAFLLQAQHPDGAWGAAPGIEPTIEETSQALAALAGWLDRPDVSTAVERGAGRLLAQIDCGELDRPNPIGLYFARLWYSEELYSRIWALEAIGRIESAYRGYRTWAMALSTT